LLADKAKHWLTQPLVSPVPIEKSADLEMDGSGESGGFSRTMAGRIACRSKDAGHTWFAVWIAHASQGGSRRSRIPLGEPTILCSRRMKVS